MKKMVHLHTHSDHSAIDGFGSPEQFVRRAVEQKSPACALTEHGSVRSAYPLAVACEEAGIKPIFGCEMYLAEDMHNHGLTDEEKKDIVKGIPIGQRKGLVYKEELRRGVRSRNHITVIAENEVGLKNLFKLTSLGWLEGYAHNRPRVDLDCLKKHQEGLIVLSGCPSGIAPEALRKGDEKQAYLSLVDLKETFGDRLYVEVMPHHSDELPAKSSQLLKLAKKLKLKIVATQDAHYPCLEDEPWQDAMLCVRANSQEGGAYRGEALIAPKRFALNSKEYWYKPRDALEQAFIDQQQLSMDEINRAIDCTLEIANRCTAKMNLNAKPLLPNYPMPYKWEGNATGYLRSLCEKGWQEREIERRAEMVAKKEGTTVEEVLQTYKLRLKSELAEISRRGIEAYMLLVADLYAWTRSQGIFAGFGRGSAGGCFVAYLLKITKIDPIEHDLMFERFLAPGRLDLPDIDADFPDRDRDRIIEFISDKYGAENVTRIGTVSTMLGKQALQDIGRILLIPRRELEAVAPFIVEPIGADRPDSTYAETIKEVKKLKDGNQQIPPKKLDMVEAVSKFHQKYPQMLKYCGAMEGSLRNLGVHPAGVVISPEPLTGLIPLEIRDQKTKRRRVVVTAFKDVQVAGLGLLKLDILALKNLSVLQDAIGLVKRDYGVELDLESIPLDDKDSIDAFNGKLFAGIFQFDTFAMRKMCESIIFHSFEEVVAATAIVRPGVSRSGLGEEYMKRVKKNKVPKKNDVYDAICKKSYGIPIYQEQFIRMFRDLAGYTAEEADKLRKTCSKKAGAKAVLKEMKRFTAGAAANGMQQKEATVLLNELASFGEYAFNRSHSVAYAMTAFVQMYVKTHWPDCFFAATLANDDKDKAMDSEFTQGELGYFEVDVYGADVNLSEERWTLSEGKLMAPINTLKGVGPATVSAIAAGRPYTSIEDFLFRVPRKACNSSKTILLFKEGALDSIKGKVQTEEELIELMGSIKSPVAKPRGKAKQASLMEFEEEGV